MNIDPGLIIVILAVLVFYLRLIVLQRERARRLAQHPPGGAKKKGKAQPNIAPADVSMLSPNRRDRIIAGVGAAAILLGILLNTGLLPFPFAQSYWWVPTALGIVAFSWAFNLSSTG